MNRIPQEHFKAGTQLFLEVPQDVDLDELNASIFFIVPMEAPYGKVTHLITPKRVVDLVPFKIVMQ